MSDKGKKWKHKKVGDLCILGRGRVISAEEIRKNPGVYPVYSSQTTNEGEMGRINTYDLEGEMVTWTTDGANAGSVFYRKGKFNCTNVCGTLVANKESELDLHFLAYALGTLTKRHVSYIGNPKLMNNVVAGIHINVPEDKSEQSAIANILATVDKAIETTDQLIAKYVRIKTGMMHDLLSKGIDKNGQIRSEKTHKFKDSKFGRIPIEWEIKLLGGITEMIQDGTHFSPKPNPLGKHRYVTSKNIRFGYLDFSNCEFISPEDHKRIYSSCRVKYGDVLLTKDGANTGNAAIYDLEEEISLLSSVAVIRGLENSLHNPFLLNYFLSYRGQRIIKDAMSGLAITRVTLEIINSFPILVPPYDEQKRIAQLIETENKIVLSQKDNLVKLSKIKTGLLRDLISGHVSVSEEFIKKLVEQAFVN